MTKTEIKWQAQEELMYGLQIAMTNYEDDDEVYAEMEKQFRRVEKFFGYEEGSFPLGV